MAAFVREHNQTPALDNPNESKQAKQGADLLGVIDGYAFASHARCTHASASDATRAGECQRG